MPIDFNTIGAGKVGTSATRRKKSSSGASDTAASDASSDESLALTGKAAQIQSLISQMMEAPAIDMSIVDPIKEKIENDRYQIEPREVANKMLDFESSYSRLR